MKQLLILLASVILIAGCDDNPTGANNILPGIIINYNADTILIDPADSFDLEVTASDPDGTIESLILYLDGYIYMERKEKPYVFQLKDLARGYHTIIVKAIDDNFDCAYSAKKVIRVPNNDSSLFYLTISTSKYPYSSTTLFDGDTLLMSIQSYSLHPEYISSVTFYMDDQVINVDKVYPYSYKIDSLYPGNHRYYARIDYYTGRYAWSNAYSNTVLPYEGPVLELSNYPSNSFSICLPDVDFNLSFKAEVVCGWSDYANVYIDGQIVSLIKNTQKNNPWQYIGRVNGKGKKGGTHTFKLEVVSNKGLSTMSTENEFDIVHGVNLTESITKIIPGDSSNTVFAIFNSGKVCKINLEKETISKIFTLSLSGAQKLKYSVKQNTLYVMYSKSSTITSINCKSGVRSSIMAPSACNDIEIDDENDRLFVACSTAVVVVSTSNIHNELFRLPNQLITSAVYNSSNEMIYLKSKESTSTYFINKYDISSNSFNLVQKSNEYSSSSDILLRPDHKALLYYDDGNTVTINCWLELNVDDIKDIIRMYQNNCFCGYSSNGLYSIIKSENSVTNTTTIALNKPDHTTTLKEFQVKGTPMGPFTSTFDDSYFTIYMNESKFLYIYKL